ncbi:hypothetical protein IEQ34_005191 [Dendrobium chrysotoxum]|uniref:Uncharacterized protein n=1 Tax=Dendrobium chrysotoxum TaxID=161865 RepID=A0AAV7HAS5_DENCH|nr:hypothetical protein IEQ34_005191 [Dendrobium chrysotoxum]
MRLLKVPDIEHLLYELLFKVGLSFHAWRLDAWMLKLTFKVPEPPISALMVAPKCQLSRCTELEAELMGALNEWNSKFIKVKYLQGEYKRKYDHKTREAKNQQIDHLQVDLERAHAMITQFHEDQRASVEKVVMLEAKNKRSQTLISEKETALTGFESSRVIEDFMKSIAFKIIIQDHIQEAHDHIYEVECIDEGFIWGFLKGVRLVQRKTRVEVEGLTPSQASDDSPLDSDGDEIESELQKAFALEVDEEIVLDLFEADVSLGEEEKTRHGDVLLEHLRPVVNLEGEESHQGVLVQVAGSLIGVEGSLYENPQFLDAIFQGWSWSPFSNRVSATRVKRGR